MNYKNRPNIPSHAIIFTLQLLLFLILPLVQAGEEPLTSTEPDPRYKSNNNRSDSSLMVMIIILFIGFCVIFTISICILQCSSDSSPLEAHGAFAGIAKADHRGLQQSEIELLPKFLYSEVKQLKIGSTLLECAVCLTEFDEVETLRLLPKCNHVFHAECIDFWLVGHDTCPVCRANIILNLAESIQKECDQSEVGDSKPSCQYVQVNIEEPEKKVKLPRPHSTGHLMARPGSDNLERFTLRLPNEVRLRLFRTTNLVALGGVSSSLRGYRSEGSGSSHYDGFLSRAGRQYKWTLPV